MQSPSCPRMLSSAIILLSAREATTSYPSIIIAEDVLYICMDNHQIKPTSSPAEGLTLVFSMFSIFDLAFEKNGRVFRFL